MDLFIRIADGQPVDHPIMGDNFRYAFPDIDTENLPPEFAPFVRTEPPAPGPYQVVVESYEWSDGVVRDAWSLRDMTSDERAAYDAEYGPIVDLMVPGSAPDVVV